MDISFGWCADSATWADANSGGAAGTARLGPRGFVQLLQTRLGLTHPPVEAPVRIAQYGALVARADHPWTRTSHALDPWATARHLLHLRDELVSAGWNHTLIGDDAPERLRALASVERLVRVGMPSVRDAGAATLAPGAADDLAEVHAMLADLAESGCPWPLGIDAITCEEPPESLPGRWPAVLGLLTGQGVRILPPPDAPLPGPPQVIVVSAADEWAAAEAAARLLSTRPQRTSVLATADTSILDQELHRRGLPALGVVPSSTDRGPQQVLGLVLGLSLGPVDVQQLAALLDLRLVDATASPDGGPDGDPVGLIPPGARRALLSALREEPGVGGPRWTAALTALNDAARNADESSRAAAERAEQAARDIDVLVNGDQSASTILPSALLSATEWLPRRLRAVSRGSGALSVTIAQVEAFRAVLALLPDRPLAHRDLQQIAGSCGGSAASPLGNAEAGPWAVSSAPAHVRAAAPGTDGTVVWWGCIEPPAQHPVRWDADEVSSLVTVGARPADPEELAALETAASLRALGSARRIIAFHPRRVLGEATALHALVAHLVTSGGDSAHPRGSGSVEDAIAQVTVDAAALVDGSVWRLDGAEIPVRTPAPRAPVARVDLTRRAVPGTQLLPQRLSFSQVENLLGCHQKWVYGSALGLRAAFATDVPTGNRMIGTLVHAVVEDLVLERAEDHPLRPSAAQIDAALARRLPHLASELLLPGRESERVRLEEQVRGSLTSFFSVLADAGITITGTEEGFEKPLDLPLETGARSVTFRGFRDIDARDSAGCPVVIDLKWTNDGRRHAASYDAAEAIQLAAYAWSVDSLESTPAAVGYFLLKQGRFVSANPALDRADRTELDVREVFERTQHEIATAFDEIAQGTVTAVSGEVRRDAELDIHPPRDALAAAAAPVKDAARRRGGIWIDAACGYCDFSLLCGLRGDHS